MNCRSVETYLASHWMDARLPSEIQSHLDGCPECHQAFSTVLMVESRLNAIREPVEAPEPTESVFWAIHAGIRSQEGSPWYRICQGWRKLSRHIASPAPSWAWVAATVVFTLMALMMVFGTLIAPSRQDNIVVPLRDQAPPMDQLRPPSLEDARLDQAITVKQVKVTLDELLRDLSGATGVTMKPSAEIADEKVSVLMEETGTLRELMGQFSRHLGGIWTRRGDPEAPQYLLSLQLKIQQEAERKASEERESRRQALASRLDEALGDLLQKAPEELQASAQDEALPEWRRFNAGSFQDHRNGALAEILASMPPEPLESLAEHGMAAVSVKSLTEDAQDIFNRAFPSQVAATDTPESPRITYRLEEEESDHLTAVVASVEGKDPIAETVILKCRLVDTNTYSSLSNSSGPATSSFEDVLERLASIHRLNIVADAYEGRALLPGLRWENLPLDQALQVIEEAGNTVTREGDTLRVRSRTWYLDRASEIPAQVMESVRKIGNRRRNPSIEDYARWATEISPHQLESVARSASPEMPSGLLVTLYRPVRLLGMLSSQQMEKAMQEGLSLSSMTPDQQHVFYEFAIEERPQLTESDLLNALFAFRKESQGDKEQVTFQVTYEERDRQSYTLELPLKSSNP